MTYIEKYKEWCNSPLFDNETKKELKNIPVIINANFGHTTPIFTFPIGGYASIDTANNIKIKIHD